MARAVESELDIFQPSDSIVPAGAPPWLVLSISEIGTLEGAGGLDNPIILAWARACGGNIAKNYKHDSIPWCKMYVEHCLRTTGFVGNDSLMALDSRKIGTALAGPVVGAIASKSREGGGHTFFVRGKDNLGRIVGVGGNQDNSVCNANFDPNVLKYNWPAGYPVPTLIGMQSLPIIATAKFTHEA